MSEAVTKLFAELAAVPGALGCGARLADRTCLVRSVQESCPAELLEKNLHHLADTTSLLSGHGLAAPQAVWAFANGKVLVAARPDGALFSLVTRADVDAGEAFRETAAKFLALA